MTLRNRFTRRMFRPRRGGRPNRHWTAATQTHVGVAAGALTEFALIVEADYRTLGTVSPSGVTVLRIVGSVLMGRAAVGVVGRVSARAAIVHIDEDEVPVFGGAFDPNSLVEMTEERLLWWGGYASALHTVIGESIFTKHDIDIRQRVKLRGSGISLIVSTDAASVQSCIVHSQLRVLAQGDFS